MANGPQARDGESDHGFLMFFWFLVVGVGLWMVWTTFHTEICYWDLWISWHLLAVVQWVPYPHWLSDARPQIAAAATRPYALSPWQLWRLVSPTAVLIAPLLWVVLFALSRKMANHQSSKVRRAITTDTLPWIMAKHAPAGIPVLYYPNLLETDPPEHRSLCTPIEWSSDHGIIINGHLDREACLKLLVAQLGTPLDPNSSLGKQLTTHERALFAVFGARLLSGKKDIALAQEYLDRINESCHRGTFNGKRGYPTFGDTDEWFERYASHPDARVWVTRHRYSRTLLHAMHLEAIKLGKLSSSHFRWLKGLDRPLWAALNTTGRRTPWVEALGVFTQTRWESCASDLGYMLTEPHLEDALDALESTLASHGLIPPKATRVST